MANIILDEKRAVKVGEVCAVNLKYVSPVYLDVKDPELSDPDDNIYFIPSESERVVSNDNEITFIKYLGNGFFMDLVSDQLLMTEIYNEDDFGSDELNAMDDASQTEISKMEEFFSSIHHPQTKDQFSDSFSIFFKNPLVINIEVAPFMSINSEITKKFASQSLEQVKSKILSTKMMAQQELKQQYSNFEDKIAEYLSDVEEKETPKLR